MRPAANALVVQKKVLFLPGHRQFALSANGLNLDRALKLHLFWFNAGAWPRMPVFPTLYYFKKILPAKPPKMLAFHEISNNL